MAAPSVQEIADFLSDCCEIDMLVEDPGSIAVERPAQLDYAGPGTVAVARKQPGIAERLARAAPSVLVVDSRLDVSREELAADGVACVAASKNPRLDIIRVADRFFPVPRPEGVSPHAVVSEEAELGAGVFAGPGCTIGRCKVGDGTVVHAGAHLYDGVTLGERCIVHSGAVLGADGFGYERDEDGVPRKFPHLAGIVIGDDVEIGANAAVDRGALSDTVIGDRSKIDNLVHVAHNARIGEDVMIAAGACVAGSATIGSRSWIGPLATVSNRITVGEDAWVSLGSVVTRDVEAGQQVTGNFALPHETFLANLRAARRAAPVVFGSRPV